MGITFGIHNLDKNIQDLVNIFHKAIVECVKIYSHFPRTTRDIHVQQMKNVETLLCIYVAFLDISTSVFIFISNSVLLTIK